jgi:hypothetical protein
MEHSIFLDSDKINSIRQSLNGKFNQIEIIDDSVTPQIVQWLVDFFSFLEDLKNGVFIGNKNIELERWAYYLGESKPYLYDFAGNEKEVLTEEEYENFMLYVSYCEIKGNLHKDNEVLEEEIINDFYLVKLPLLEPILSSLIKGIAIKSNNSNKYKKHFEDLKTHIEEFYFKIMIDNSIEKETQETTPKEPDWHPFHNNDVRDFYLYIESKYPNEINKTKSIFGALWKFFVEEGLIDLNEKSRIMKSYIDWINKRFDFQGEESITKLQTNTEGFDLSAFEKHYIEFESSKGDGFRFHDFRDENIQRTKKKRLSV